MNAIPKPETQQDAARRLFSSEIAGGFKPAALHCYRDADGTALFYRARLKHPDTGRKVIKPMHLDGLRFRMGEPPAPKDGKPLYRLPELLRADPGEPVVIVEGEGCADAVAALGIVATTSGSAASAAGADWSPLRGRSVLLWPDNDPQGHGYADTVADTLRALGCTVEALDVAVLGLPDKGDCVDWLAEHPEATAADVLALPRNRGEHNDAAKAERDPATVQRLAGNWSRERTIDPDDVRLLCAASIISKPIRWLWRYWLARGKFHIMAGAPGTGKTTLALSLAAVITRGGPWPDGTTAAPGNVLIWSSEDDVSDTLVPRLRAAGADLSRVFFVGEVGHGEESRPFDPAYDLIGLERAAETVGEVSLLIADPVVSIVTGDSHKNTEVRRALQPMVHLATRLNCAVLGITHFSKGTAGRDPTERVTGSVAFGAIARLVLVTAKSEDGTRLLARAKSNIGPDGGGFSYSLEQMQTGNLEASVVRWGAPLEGSARELLGDVEVVGDSPRDDAAAWLADMLAGAEVPVKTIKAQATAAGLSWRTIERAKAELGVVAEAVGNSDGSRGAAYWTWRLPIHTATIHTASLTTRIGGLNQTQSPCGFQGDSGIKTANSQSDGVNPGDDDMEVVEL